MLTCGPLKGLTTETKVIYNLIQYKHEYYYSGINAVEFGGHIGGYIVILDVSL